MVRPSACAVLRLTMKSNSRGLLDGEIGGLGALEDAVYIVGRTPDHRWVVRPVGHQPARGDKWRLCEHRWQAAVPGGESRDAPTIHGEDPALEYG
jgi:hypothetical protein